MFYGPQCVTLVLQRLVGDFPAHWDNTRSLGMRIGAKINIYKKMYGTLTPLIRSNVGGHAAPSCVGNTQYRLGGV